MNTQSSQAIDEFFLSPNSIPVSLDPSDYEWYSDDDYSLKDVIISWIASGFNKIEDPCLVEKIIFWLDLNDFLPTNPIFKLRDFFINYCEISESELDVPRAVAFAIQKLQENYLLTSSASEIY